MAPEIAAEAPIIGSIAPRWVTRCASAPTAAITSMKRRIAPGTETPRQRGAERNEPSEIETEMHQVGVDEGVGEKSPQIGAEAAGKRAADGNRCRSAPE